MLTVEKAEEVLNHTERKCGTCVHVRVCSIFRAISPLIERNFTDGTKPFDAEDVARICREYMPDTLRLLK